MIRLGIALQVVQALERPFHVLGLDRAPVGEHRFRVKVEGETGIVAVPFPRGGNLRVECRLLRQTDQRVISRVEINLAGVAIAAMRIERAEVHVPHYDDRLFLGPRGIAEEWEGRQQEGGGQCGAVTANALGRSGHGRSLLFGAASCRDGDGR
jgi:hypothetical protein